MAAAPVWITADQAARLALATPVSVARADIQFVATEYGMADLSGCDADTRAARLIALAAPTFRAGLAADRATLRQRTPP